MLGDGVPGESEAALEAYGAAGRVGGLALRGASMACKRAPRLR